MYLEKSGSGKGVAWALAFVLPSLCVTVVVAAAVCAVCMYVLLVLVPRPHGRRRALQLLAGPVGRAGVKRACQSNRGAGSKPPALHDRQR
jgi:hypothetical protein